MNGSWLHEGVVCLLGVDQHVYYGPHQGAWSSCVTRPEALFSKKRYECSKLVHTRSLINHQFSQNKWFLTSRKSSVFARGQSACILWPTSRSLIFMRHQTWSFLQQKEGTKCSEHVHTRSLINHQFSQNEWFLDSPRRYVFARGRSACIEWPRSLIFMRHQTWSSSTPRFWLVDVLSSGNMKDRCQ